MNRRAYLVRMVAIGSAVNNGMRELEALLNELEADYPAAAAPILTVVDHTRIVVCHTYWKEDEETISPGTRRAGIRTEADITMEQSK